jgi:acyl-CoA synthetase (AMP-forming)/AMP-acid ligase II
LTNILIGPLASSVHSGEWRQIGRAERKILRHPGGLFDELLTSVDQTAAIVAALAELGVRPEDRVLSMLADGPGFAEAFVGTFAHGAIPLPVNPLLPAH